MMSFKLIEGDCWEKIMRWDEWLIDKYWERIEDEGLDMSDWI